MLNGLVRRFFKHFDMNISDENCVAFIRATGLSKLPIQYVWILSTMAPFIEMILAKLKNEEIDWGDLSELSEGK